MGDWALVEIYPLKPLTQHVLAGHGANSTTEDACPSTGQPTSPPPGNIEPKIDMAPTSYTRTRYVPANLDSQCGNPVEVGRCWS